MSVTHDDHFSCEQLMAMLKTMNWLMMLMTLVLFRSRTPSIIDLGNVGIIMHRPIACANVYLDYRDLTYSVPAYLMYCAVPARMSGQ